MSQEFDSVVTPDDMMEEFVQTYDFSDEQISDSIFTCVDNYIDDLCIKMMDDENSILEDDSDVDTPFVYILDKVIDHVDTLESISTKASVESLFSGFDGDNNDSDPDYEDDPTIFDNISAEDFQVYTNQIKDDADESEDRCELTPDFDAHFVDSNFNA